MQAAQAQLNVTAQNVANADTPGYQSARVDLVELSTGGVAVGGITRDASAGAMLPHGQQGSNVDLAAQMENLRREQMLYGANAAVVRVADQMTGTLLDMLDTGQTHRHSHPA